MMRLILMCWVGISLTCCTGCTVIVTQLKDRRDDFAIHRTNRYIAHEAWAGVRECYEDLPCRVDFEKGFKRGYSDRASGLNGCPPALPPRRYWRAKLMGHEAIERANAWFDGYRHGVVVAEQDGNADLARVPTSVPPVPHCQNETFESSISSPIGSSPSEYMNIPTEIAPEPMVPDSTNPQPGTKENQRGPASGSEPPKYDEAVPEIPPAPAPALEGSESPPPSVDPNLSPSPALPPGNVSLEDIPPEDMPPAAPGTATL